MRAEVSIIFILPRSYNNILLLLLTSSIVVVRRKRRRRFLQLLIIIISLSLFKYGTRMAFHILLYFGTDLFPTQTNNYNFV